MGIENYFLIALAYGTGVYFAYRAGYYKGLDYGINIAIDRMAEEISEMTDKSAGEIVRLVRANIARKALKASRS